MDKHYSGHMYRNSAAETDSDCGNCDGARCETCSIYYTVRGTDDRFYSIAEAKEAEEILSTLIPMDRKEYYLPDEYNYYEKDGKLLVELYISESGIYTDIECSEESPVYKEKLEGAIKRREIYDKCPCQDKDNEHDNPCCSKFGCTDDTCYNETKYKGRTTKKWYM